MADTAYRFAVGDINCIIFNDGCLQDPEDTFGLNCIYIESGSRKMLVDNGCGKLFMDTAGKLLANMKAAGISPADIDTIIFDHAHIDHVCGTFDLEGNPVFPKARYIITKKEWDYVCAGPTDNATQNNFYAPARKYLIPLKDRFDAVEDNYLVAPGITLVPANGHTPGNSMVEIVSKRHKLLCIGDIIHSLKEFSDPKRCAAFDVDEEQALKTRAAVLPVLAKDKTFVFAAHFTFPCLGYIREKGGVFRWEPLK